MQIHFRTKKAESDNLTILIFLILIIAGCFYVVNWYTGGALTQSLSDFYHEKVSGLKVAVGLEQKATAELAPQCDQEFKCETPINEKTCPDLEYANYNKLCNIE